MALTWRADSRRQFLCHSPRALHQALTNNLGRKKLGATNHLVKAAAHTILIPFRVCLHASATAVEVLQHLKPKPDNPFLHHNPYSEKATTLRHKIRKHPNPRQLLEFQPYTNFILSPAARAIRGRAAPADRRRQSDPRCRRHKIRGSSALCLPSRCGWNRRSSTPSPLRRGG